jgi:hypothetical protein
MAFRYLLGQVSANILSQQWYRRIDGSRQILDGSAFDEGTRRVIGGR